MQLNLQPECPCSDLISFICDRVFPWLVARIREDCHAGKLRQYVFEQLQPLSSLSLVVRRDKPVMFPPDRARLATNP